MPETILVTGATGTVGSRVVQQLLKRTEGIADDKPRIVAATRHADKPEAQALSALGAHIVAMDFDHPGTVEQAFGHVDKLFLLTPPELSSSQASQVAIAAAEASGVKYIVKLSAFGAEVEPPITLMRLHRSAEMLIMGSGADWTFLRPNGFMQNFQQYAESIGPEFPRRALRDRAHDEAVASDVLYGVAIAAAGVGAYFLWSGYHRERPPGTKLMVAPTMVGQGGVPTGGGLMLGGQF